MSIKRVNATTLIPMDHGRYAREVFSLEDARVTLEPDRSWQCSCKAYAQDGRCTHIEQAQRFRPMRGVKRVEDTIELELSAEELKGLYIAASVENTGCRTNEVAIPRKRAPRHSRWAAVIAAVVVAGTSSGITYLATVRAQPIPAVARVASPEPRAAALPAEAPPRPSVRVVNPFDATEVFEFPAGMSENDARHAVAEFLLDRARGRLAAPAGTRWASGKATHHEQPERATHLADRS